MSARPFSRAAAVLCGALVLATVTAGPAAAATPAPAGAAAPAPTAEVLDQHIVVGDWAGYVVRSPGGGRELFYFTFEADGTLRLTNSLFRGQGTWEARGTDGFAFEARIDQRYGSRTLVQEGTVSTYDFSTSGLYNRYSTNGTLESEGTAEIDSERAIFPRLG